ncbi:MAG: hypothetical protein ACR2JC_00325 [Chloroflexota bacterium]
MVTCGRGSAWYLERDDNLPRHQPAFALHAVDTTGCGDVFHGAYAAGLDGAIRCSTACTLRRRQPPSRSPDRSGRPIRRADPERGHEVSGRRSQRMTMPSLNDLVEERLEDVPIMDAHTHLVGGRMGARGLHDVLLYHMVISELYAAGCPSGSRLTQYPDCPSEEEASARIEEALPYLPFIRNTSTYWGLHIILTDLYDWHEPLVLDNWRRLDGIIRERSADPSCPQAVLDRVHIDRVTTELARRGDGEDDANLQYALEWAFFTRCQWGEFDTPLYELERCWGRPPESPTPVGGARPPTERTIRSLDDVDAAVLHYVGTVPYDQIVALTNHISTDLHFQEVSDEEMAAALARRANAGAEERDIYASYTHEKFLGALEERPDRVVYQFSLGAEPLPFETGSRISQTTIAQLADIIARHPKVHFQCFLANRHANQSLCTLARELPNLSLIGYWWHNFYPDTIRQVMGERLDMVPVNKQIGFFSDAYSVEWTYAKAIIVRKQLAQVLAQRIDQGQYTVDDAIGIARSILYESPQTLLGMRRRDRETPVVRS